MYSRLEVEIKNLTLKGEKKERKLICHAHKRYEVQIVAIPSKSEEAERNQNFQLFLRPFLFSFFLNAFHSA